MLSLERLKAFNTDSSNMEELMAAATAHRGLEASYKEFGIEVPAWVEGVGKSIAREIKLQYADFVDKKVAEARLKKAKLVDRLHPEISLQEADAELEKWTALATK
jgi:hypothetical protein